MNPYERMGAPVPQERYVRDDEEASESEQEWSDESPQEAVRVPFDQNAAIEKERGVLEKLEGKARQVAKVMALVTALSFGAGYGQESYAADRTDDTPRAERIEYSHERTPREERLTSAGKMFDRIVDDAREDMGKIKTVEDAEWLLRAHFDKFVGEYYMPTKGHVKKTAYGTRIREYSEGDLHSLLENAHEMKDILNQLHEKYGIDHTNRSQQIDHMIQKVERSNSYASMIQGSLMKQVEKQLGPFRIRIKHR